VGRKSILVLAVGAFVGALAEGAMADILAEPLQSEQVLLSSVSQEFVPEGNYAGTNWQASGPVEPVTSSMMVSEEPWMKEYGND
jgi:hypothetical protein